MTLNPNDWLRVGPPSVNSAFARVFPQAEASAGEVEMIYALCSEYPTWCIDSGSPVLIRSSITDGTFLS